MGVLKNYMVKVIGYKYEIAPKNKYSMPSTIFTTYSKYLSHNIPIKLIRFYDDEIYNWMEQNKQRLIYQDKHYIDYSLKKEIQTYHPKITSHLTNSSHGWDYFVAAIAILPKSKSKSISTHIDTRTHNLQLNQTRILNGEKPIRFCESKKCLMCENIDRVWAIKDSTKFGVNYDGHCSPIDVKSGGLDINNELPDSERKAITVNDKFKHTKYIKDKHAQDPRIEGVVHVTPRLRCGHVTCHPHQNVLTYTRDRTWDKSQNLNQLRLFTEGKLPSDPQGNKGNFGISVEEIDNARKRLVRMKILSTEGYPSYGDAEPGSPKDEERKKLQGTAPYELSVKEKQRFAEIQMKRLITFVRTSDNTKYDHPQVKLCDIDRSDLCLLTQKLAGSFMTWEELVDELTDIYTIMEGIAGTYIPTTYEDCKLANWMLANKTSQFPEVYDLDLSVLVTATTPELSQIRDMLKSLDHIKDE